MNYAMVHEDERLLVVCKPAGLFVHESKLDRRAPSLLSLLKRERPGAWLAPVHRLDRPTSGLVVFAKDAASASLLGKAWASGAVEKTYFAVTRGWFEEAVAIHSPLADLKEEGDDEDGVSREALTEVTPKARFVLPIATKRHPEVRLALVVARPRTGRRHQIRRHLKHVFHPIVGDTVYGDGEVNRIARQAFGVEGQGLLLHASALSFPHPADGGPFMLRAPDPAWVEALRPFATDAP